MSNALELRSVTAGYGQTTVLRDVSVEVPAGSVVALLGPNGAGKTTLLRVAAGLMSPGKGDVLMSGASVTKSAANRRTGDGMCLIPEGRGVFPNLSVRENLILQIPAKARSRRFDAAIEAFPALGERLGQLAGSLSGGQQQMLALSRCFLGDPKVVLLDEVSMGLAPKVIDDIFGAIGRLGERGISLLLVEQYVSRALAVADSVYLLAQGQVRFSGPPSRLDKDEIARGYLGG